MDEKIIIPNFPNKMTELNGVCNWLKVSWLYQLVSQPFLSAKTGVLSFLPHFLTEFMSSTYSMNATKQGLLVVTRIWSSQRASFSFYSNQKYCAIIICLVLVLWYVKNSGEDYLKIIIISNYTTDKPNNISSF